MARLSAGLVLVAMILALCLLPAAALHAATLGDGQAIKLGGADDFLATIWSYMKGPAGKVVGGFMMYKGLTSAGGNDRQSPVVQVGSGVGMAFVPNVMTTSFEAAPAATGAWLAPALPYLAQVWQGFWGVRLVRDPIFLALFLTTLLLLALARSRPVVVR